MSGTHNKPQQENNFNNRKLSHFAVELNYFSFSHPNPHTYLNTNS